MYAVAREGFEMKNPAQDPSLDQINRREMKNPDQDPAFDKSNLVKLGIPAFDQVKTGDNSNRVFEKAKIDPANLVKTAPLGNPYLDKKAVNVDLAKNSVELPNHVSGIVSDDLELGGNLSLVNEHKLELGKGTKDKGESSGTLQYKGDYLHMVGAGKDGDKSKIKLWDNVEIGSLLQVNGELSVKGDSFFDGIQTMNKKQILKEGQDVDGLSKHTGKVHINPNDKDQTNMPDLAIGDGLSGFKKGSNNIMFTSKATDIGGFDQTGLYSNKNTALEMGKGVTKQVDAGKIAYQRFSDGLDIVGAGEEGKGRKIKLWDNVEVNGGLTVNGPVNMPGLKQAQQQSQFAIGNEIEFAKELTAQGKKEVNAGKIVYNGFGSEALAIVGAGLGPRRVKMWDDVEVTNTLKVNNNIQTGANGIEFAPELTGQRKKEVNAGKIVYNGFGSEALAIVGAGLGPRRVKMWDDVEVSNTLKVNNNIQTGANGIEFGPELFGQGKKEVNAGKIVYNGWGNHLAIVGATQGETTAWNPRKVHVFDELSVGMDTTVGRNLTVLGDTTTVKNLNITGDLTIGTPNNKWIITVRQGDNNNKWLEFLHQNSDNRNNYSDNAGHIIMSQDGNLWLPRSTAKGWVADNIGTKRNN